MVKQHQRRGIHHKPLNTAERQRRHIVAVVTTLRSKVVEPIVSQVHDQHTSKRMQAQTVIEHIHSNSHYKSNAHQRQGIGFNREHEQICDIQKAKRSVEQHHILKYQDLIQQIDKKGYNLEDTYPAHLSNLMMTC